MVADAQYDEPRQRAFGAALVSRSRDLAGAEAFDVQVDLESDYVPGSFALRELPVLLALLAEAGEVATVLVDGYVDLDADGRAGLGLRLHEATGLTVIGVAKSRFRSATHALEVLRGSSSRPLFVTAVGIGREAAADLVRSLPGAGRVPEAMRQVDRRARETASAPP